MIQALVIIGAGANVAGSLVYVWNTLRGVSQPNRMTFLLWALAPMIATAALLSAGVTWPVIPVFASGFCPLLIFLASFANKNAYWQLGRIDYTCGALSALALILWMITKDPIVAVVLAIASDGLAGYPTLLKAWQFPETETLWGYLGAALSGFAGALAASEFNFIEIAFPAYLFLICSSIAAGIIRGRMRGLG